MPAPASLAIGLPPRPGYSLTRHTLCSCFSMTDLFLWPCSIPSSSQALSSFKSLLFTRAYHPISYPHSHPEPPLSVPKSGATLRQSGFNPGAGQTVNPPSKAPEDSSSLRLKAMPMETAECRGILVLVAKYPSPVRTPCFVFPKKKKRAHVLLVSPTVEGTHCV